MEALGQALQSKAAPYQDQEKIAETGTAVKEYIKNVDVSAAVESAFSDRR